MKKPGLVKRISSMMVLAFAFAGISHAAPPKAQDYINLYKKNKGYFSDTKAREELKKAFEESATTLLEENKGSLADFYSSMAGQLALQNKNDAGFFQGIQKTVSTPTSETVLSVLNEFMSEKTGKAIQTLLSDDGKESSDPFVRLLISKTDGIQEDVEAFKEEQHGQLAFLKNAADGHMNKQTNKSSLGKAVGAVGLAAALYWFGPAYLMVGVEKIFPYAWTYVMGPVPTSLVPYYAVYYPALKHATGFVYNHSSEILCAGWLVGAVVLDAATKATCSIANGALDLSRGAFNFFWTLAQKESKEKFKKIPMDDNWGIIEKTAQGINVDGNPMDDFGFDIDLESSLSGNKPHCPNFAR